MTVAPMPGPGEEGGEPAATGDADHELRGVARPGEGDERLRGVRPDHLVIGAAELLHQCALSGEGGRVGLPQAVLAGDVHGQELAAGGACRDACAAPEQGLAFGAAGERDDDPFARLPFLVDAVLGAVALQRAVDLVGQPEQGQLAQGGQVAEAEVVRQRRVDPDGRVDLAVGETVAERLRGEVDDLDLGRRSGRPSPAPSRAGVRR